MASLHLGFIGLGNMGAPMAGRLLDAGHTLTVFDTRAAALQPFTARGAAAAASPAAVASAVDTVLVSLPTPAIVRQVALGEGGIASGTRVKTFVDLSTTGPRAAQEIAAALATHNIVAVDSPVSGGVAGAKKGTLAVMVSGPKDRHDALVPALQAIGKVFYLGEKPGLGQMMKLANNLMSATAMAISCEAIVMGVKAGLDAKVMVDVINAGSGRNSATQEKFPRSILPRTFDYGFATGLMYKDVKLCLEEAQALGVPMWVASAVQQLWLLANNELGPESDFTRIIECLEGWAGVEVKG
jgi:3-hydroxyisobutyrate dehydrogenase-like beta-hydroxyacid dehydrogenase